jgi:tetratricopeptide (TPR) repeat protein
MVLILIPLGLATRAQALAFRDPETLWRHSLERSPRAPMAHFNLAVLLQERGDRDAAIRHYLLALETEADLVEAHVNLANLYADRGELDRAIGHYRQALASDPRRVPAHYNLALALEARGDLRDAELHYRAAIREDPEFAGAHNNLAIVLYSQGRHAEAWTELQRFRELGGAPHPEFVRALEEKVGRTP